MDIIIFFILILSLKGEQTILTIKEISWKYHESKNISERYGRLV